MKTIFNFLFLKFCLVILVCVNGDPGKSPTDIIFSNSIYNNTTPPLALEVRASIAPEGNDSVIRHDDGNVIVTVAKAEKLIQDPLYSSPLFETNVPLQVDQDDHIFIIIQKAVSDIYFAIKRDSDSRRREEARILEENFRGRLHEVDLDLNAKILSLEMNSMSKIHALADQHAEQRKEDMKTFSENLNEMKKTQQTYVEAQRLEIQEMKSTVETSSKGHSNLANKISQLQKSIHSLDGKLSDMVRKHPEDIGNIQEAQKVLEMMVDEVKNEVRARASLVTQMQTIVAKLEQASLEDTKKLRKAMIREQKKDPVENCIRHLKHKNLAQAVKQWRVIEQITDDLKEALPEDMIRIIEESYNHLNPSNLMTIVEFIHKAVANGDRRLKEASYGYLLQELGAAKQLTDSKKLSEVFQLAQYMKADLVSTYNTSSSTAEIVSRLPEAVRLITFEKVRLSLPSRGYLKVGTDRKVTLVPEDGRFYDNDEVSWHFEYDKEKSDGSFFIKSDKLHKYLLTIQEGYNSYGFKKQILFMTGNKRENGTRFEVASVSGDNILLRSNYWNGYLTWKSNIQTIYGDDDSYFVLLEDKKNGPSPYWIVESENDFTK